MTEKITQYKSRLAPNQQVRDRVWQKISQRSDTSNLVINHQQMKNSQSFWQQPWLQKSLMALGAVLFFALPLGYTYLTGNSYYGDSLAAPPTNGYDPGYGEAGSNSGTTLYESKDMDLLYPDDRYYGEEVPYDSTQSESRLQRREAQYTLETNNPRGIKQEVEAILEQHNGYLLATSLTTSSRQIASLELRVPVDKFNQFINAVLALDVEVVYENMQISDLQGKYAAQTNTKTDLEAKIKGLKAQLSDDLDKNKRAQLVVEINKLQNRLDQVDAAVEELVNKGSFSDINLRIQQPSSNNFAGVNEWIDISGFLFTLRVTINFWINVLAWITVPGTVYLVYRFFKNRKFKKDGSE